MASWKTNSIGGLSELVTKGTTPTSVGFKFTDEGINFVKVESITQSGLFLSEKLGHIDNNCHQALKRSQLANGDILFSIAGALGRTARVTSDILPANTNQALAIIRLRPSEKVLPEFVIRALSSGMVLEQIEKQRGGVAQQNLSLAQVKNFQIPLPPFPEQKRIVAILDEALAGIDAAIAHTEQNRANARALFESYLNGVFSQQGEGWVEKKLGGICSIKHGFAFKGEFFRQEGEFVLLTPGSFYEYGGYRDQGVKTKYYVGEIPDGYLLGKGDFLFAMTEQAAGLLGSSLIVPESGIFLHNQRLGLVQVNDGVNWHNDFFFHQFNTKRFRAEVHSSASGVKVRHTSPKKLGAISIFFPPNKTPQKIVADKLNEILGETKRLETIYQQKLDCLAELKQAILHKAFAGELSALPEKASEEAVA